MNENRAKQVMSIEYDGEMQRYVVRFPENEISVIASPDLDIAMDMAAKAVDEYRDQQSHSGRIAAIKDEMQRLQIELEQLESAVPEELPLYSLTNPAALAIYKGGVDCLRPERINYWEQQLDVTVSYVCLVESPWVNLYKTPLLWQWAWYEKGDTVDE